VSATAIGIQTVSEGNVRRVVLGDDGLGGIKNILDGTGFEVGQIFLVPFEVFEIDFQGNRFKSIVRVQVRSVPHRDAPSTPL
jgi:hypothetical protein